MSRIQVLILANAPQKTANRLQPVGVHAVLAPIRMSNAKQPPNAWAICVCKAKIIVALPVHTATPVHQTKPPVHHAHRPGHRLRVRPVSLIVIFRPEPPVRTVLARINTHLIVITSKKKTGHLPRFFYSAVVVSTKSSGFMEISATRSCCAPRFGIKTPFTQTSTPPALPNIAV